MMTKEQAKAKLATADAKVDFFEGLTARIERMIDEIESARHDNVLWKFGKDWTLADNVEDGWNATETACEGLGYLHELCEQQLNREVNKSETLYDYLTRLEGQAKPATVTANSVNLDDDSNRDFDETQIDFVDAEDRLNYLSALEPFKAEYVAALHGIYLDTAGYFDEEILPAVDWAEMMAPMYVTDHSTTAYRKNADGTFTEDAAAYERLREVELKMFKFGHPELDEAQADTDKPAATNSADIADVQAEVLNANWKDAQRQLDKRITVEMQGGGTCAIDKDSDIRLTKIKDGYAFVDYGEIVAVGAKVVLGRYDTPAQVKEVIDKFGKSIFGNRFEFPHVEDVGKSDIEIAEELTAFLLKVTPWHAGFMDLTLQDGKETAASPRTAIIEPDWHGNGRFAFVTPWNEVFARYDTASQVRTVIYRIKHAVEDKRDKFKYPTLAELTAPDYREKQWAVDFDIYHADSDLTDAELEAYTDRLRDAMTANGNRACVELETCLISVWGDSGGDNLTVDKIFREMADRGCWVEFPEDDEDTAE